MSEEKQQVEKSAAGGGAETVPAPLPVRVLDWARQGWRPAATVASVTLTLLLTWHVFAGKNGLSVWQQKRAEDRQLQKEIQDLEQENTRLRHRIDHLKSDPKAIEHEARERLHYAKPGEVIYTLPSQEQIHSSGAEK